MTEVGRNNTVPMFFLQGKTTVGISTVCTALVQFDLLLQLLGQEGFLVILSGCDT